jgi:hypothetical protein
MRTLIALVLLTAACSHNLIPGTNIPDDPQNRAVLDVFGRYKEAMETRDANAVLSLAAPAYYDPGDTSRAKAPIDLAALQKRLPADLGKLTGLKLEISVKDMKVEGDKANIDYFQVLRYAVKTPSGETWRSESDDARMRFVRVAQGWKIASGL